MSKRGNLPNRKRTVSAENRLSQEWKADRYVEHAPFVPVFGQSVLQLLNPQPGERILDLGCGNGVLSEKIREAGATVVGIDGSRDMVEAAKQRSIDVHLIDAHQLTFDGEFDATFSNAALHWMKRDPVAVLSGVRRALRQGGRFAAEFGGHGNVATIYVALVAVLTRHGIENADSLSPWYFPTTDEYRERLEDAGFRVDSIDLFPRPTVLPTDMRGWLETFGGQFFSALPATERADALSETVDLLRPALCDTEGRWTVHYVRLRFLAHSR